MNNRNDRELCIKKDFGTPRNIKRIPVICNLIREYWERRILNDSSIGFLKIIDSIEEPVYKDFFSEKCCDPFYLEDDQWYDILMKLIEESKKLKHNNPLEHSMDIKEIVKCFEDYWLLHPDYRLQQIFNVFIEALQKDMAMFDTFDSKVWRKFFMEKRIEQLENGIKTGKRIMTDIENGDVFTFFPKEVHKRYMDNLTFSIQEKQNTLNALKEEYKNDFEL